MLDESNPDFRAARRGFEAVLNEFHAAKERIDEEYAARRTQAEESKERYEREREESVNRATEAIKAKQEAAEAKPEEEPKPENAWVQPTRRADSGARIGRFEDDDTPLPVPDAPAPPPTPPAPAPVAAPPPVPAPEPAPAGRHRLDDDEDFEGGSFVRG